MIPVTRSFLPPIEEYIAYLQEIWESNQLTNNGPLVQKLEEKLKNYLGVRHLFLVNNGTVALQIAIKALGLHGEVITTPFSYVATTSSLVWEGCTPVFADIDPDTLCIDPEKIEAAISPRTTGILATHVYGIPCDVEGINKIADQYGIRVIYDAAHTFGVKYKGVSLVSYGNISTLSFHATKLFHTVEGGAIVTNDDELAHRVRYMRNFGHKSQDEFYDIGINGKSSEFHAAMGLCNLSYIKEIINRRKEITNIYDSIFKNSTLKRPALPENTVYNYAYYPILFPSEERLLNARFELNTRNIFPRRYFFPSLDLLPYVRNSTELINSKSLSKRVICLPLFLDLQINNIVEISNLILKSLED